MTQNNQKIQQLYNDVIPNRYKNDYEFIRWFKSARLRLDFFMMSSVIKHHLEDKIFDRCLELGPGPGTWTRLLFRRNPKAQFDLVDISEAMRDQFVLEMRAQKNVDYHLSDFLSFEVKHKYDLFFSSRAIEYIDDKAEVFKKIYGLLKEGGQGVVITKNENFIKKKSDRFHHKGQLDQGELTVLMKEAGLKNIQVFPAIIRPRRFKRRSEKMFMEHMDKPVSSSIRNNCESFLITFEK